MGAIFLCTEVHHGYPCEKPLGHSDKSNDAATRQHIANEGRLKWPTLHELDPNEGYNDYVTHRV